MTAGSNEHAHRVPHSDPILSPGRNLAALPRSGQHEPRLTGTSTVADAPRSSGRLVTWVLLAFAAVWLLACSATSLSPPVDNLEQLTWRHSLQWGYYKHPPLTTALAWLGVQVLGPHAWTTYVLGGTLTLSAMTLFWRLLRELRGPRYAILGLLAALCITFYNGRLYYYNHNVVLLLLVVSAAAACWRAFQLRTWGAWALVGVVFGLGALAKYQIAVTALCAFGSRSSRLPSGPTCRSRTRNR